MGKPNALSRWADHGSGQGDNDNLMLLAPELFWIHALAGARFQGNEQNILQEVWHSLKSGVKEESIAKAAKELRKDKGRCKGSTQTLIPDTSAVKPEASQSTDGNLLWSVVYISDTACLCAGTANDTQPALANPHPLRRPWPVTGRYAAGVP
jgi:hypothetical protein